MSTDDKFIEVGRDEPEFVDPNQTSLVSDENQPATPADLVAFLDENFPNFGGKVGGQWRGENIWVEYGAGQVTIWNAKNMRYVHQKFGSATPNWIKDAIKWITENKDVEQPIPEHVQESGQKLAEMWENNKANAEKLGNE